MTRTDTAHAYAAPEHEGPHRGSAAARSQRRLAIVLGLTATYMLVEVAGGLLTNSLALLADAAHMLTDVLGLGMALAAIRFAQRPATQARTYGFYRAEILAALVNSLVLFGIAAYILYEAWRRFQAPPDVSSLPMLAVATGGLIVNLIGARLLHAGTGESLNVRGAFLEVVADLLGSLGAATGALASGIPMLLVGGVPATADPIRPMFLVYGVLGLVAAGLSLSLPPSVELAGRTERVHLTPESRSRVARIALLFGVDSFAGGFVLQSFIALWFYATYPESAPVLPLVFFAAGVLSAFSFLVAARMGERFGLLETMVFTHIPSSLLLIAVPLLPGFLPALGAYLARMAISQMDVPTRQAYIAGIVAKEERTAANALTNTARNVAQSIGPFSSGAVIAAIGSLAVPFLIGGGLKIVYDLAIFASFRKVKPEAV